MSTHIAEYSPQLRPEIVMRADGEGWTLESPVNAQKVFVDAAVGIWVPHFARGEFTLRQMLQSAEFTENSRSHRLRDLLSLLKRLDDADFLKSPLPLEDARQIESLSSPFLAKRSYLDRRLWVLLGFKNLRLPVRNQALAAVYFLATIALGVAAACSWIAVEPSHLFYTPDAGYHSVLIKIIGTLCALFSVAAIWTAVGSWLATGTVDALELAVFPLAVALRATESYIPSRGLRNLAWTARLFVYLVSWMLFCKVAHVSAAWIHDMGVIAVLATFSLMHPYRQSHITQQIERTADPEKLRHLWPYLRSRSLFSFIFGGKVVGESFLLLYSSLAVAWSILFIDFTSDYITQDWPLLYLAFRHGEWSAYLVALLYGLFLLAGLGPLALMVVNNVLYPLWGSLQIVVRKWAFAWGGRGSSGESYTQAVAAMPLFRDLSQQSLQQLLSHSRTLQLPAGVPLLVQGDQARELYVLIDGQVEVSRRETSGLRQPLARLDSPSLFGETALTDAHRRQADVSTSKRSLLLRIDGQRARNNWFEQLESGPKAKFFQRLLLQQYLDSSQAFHRFPAELATTLESLGRVREVSAGEVLAHEGATEEAFYLILRGRAEVIKASQAIETLNQGSFFGEIAVLRHAPRTATVRMLESGAVFELDRRGFWELVARYPMLGVEIEAVAEARRGATSKGAVK